MPSSSVLGRNNTMSPVVTTLRASVLSVFRRRRTAHRNRDPVSLSTRLCRPCTLITRPLRHTASSKSSCVSGSPSVFEEVTTVRLRVSSPLPLTRSLVGNASRSVDCCSNLRVQSRWRERVSRFLRNSARTLRFFFDMRCRRDPSSNASKREQCASSSPGRKGKAARRTWIRSAGEPQRRGQPASVPRSTPAG